MLSDEGRAERRGTATTWTREPRAQSGGFMTLPQDQILLLSGTVYRQEGSSKFSFTLFFGGLKCGFIFSLISQPV